MRVLFLLRGIPGAGKSSLANYLFDTGVVFEADQYWIKNGKYEFDACRIGDAHRDCQKRVEEAMKENKRTKGRYYPELIVANTLTTEKELKPYYDMAEKYKYTVVSLIVENRHNGKSIHNVPEETLLKMKKRFEISL